MSNIYHGSFLQKWRFLVNNYFHEKASLWIFGTALNAPLCFFSDFNALTPGVHPQKGHTYLNKPAAENLTEEAY